MQPSLQSKNIQHVYMLEVARLRWYGAMITRAPFTPECSCGTASSHRFNWSDNSGSTNFSHLKSEKSILRFEYQDPACVAFLDAMIHSPFPIVARLTLDASLWQRLKMVICFILIYKSLFIDPYIITHFQMFCHAWMPMMVSQTRRISWILKQFGTCRKYRSILARKLAVSKPRAESESTDSCIVGEWRWWVLLFLLLQILFPSPSFQVSCPR